MRSARFGHDTTNRPGRCFVVSGGYAAFDSSAPPVMSDAAREKMIVSPRSALVEEPLPITKPSDFTQEQLVLIRRADQRSKLTKRHTSRGRGQIALQ